MPNNPYTSQSIASYNASPPPDDGSVVLANKITWNSTIKTKLADPIKTLSEAINAAVLSAFGQLVMTTDAAEENVVIQMQQFGD